MSMHHLSAKGLCFLQVDVLLLVIYSRLLLNDSSLRIHQHHALDWLIPKNVNVVKEWTMHSITSSSVHDLIISVSH